MRKNLIHPVLTLFLLASASITWAQTISSQKGLTTAVFQTQSGNIKVYLPDDIRAGDIISGTIVAEATGKNEKQVDKNLLELQKYSIGINTEKYPVAKTGNFFQFAVQRGKPISLSMELINEKGAKTSELSVPLENEKAQRPASVFCVIPTHAITGSPCRITGPFDGDASNTKCSIDAKSLDILAESPRQCIVSYPADAAGIKALNVQEKEKQLCSQQVSSVQMNVSAGKLNLLKGEKTYIDVNITGLQNLPDTAILTLNNVSTGIVLMLPANNILIPLSPDSVGTGVFNKRFDIQSLKNGNFLVNVDLNLPEVQAENPPTKPLDNPPPKDTTQPNPQPHDSTTVSQCPPCKCSCSADILFDGKKDDVLSYSVDVKSSCSGLFGNPPCAACSVKDVTYEWTISYSFDKPIKIIGGNNGVGFKFQNPHNGAFVLSVKVTVTCSDGSQCTCTAKTTGHPPTIPVDSPGKCECSANCAIKKIKTTCDEASFTADVLASCKSTNPKTKCAVALITYLWYTDDGGKGVAGISGSANGKSVKVKLGNAGHYTLYLKVTVTCSNGAVCEYICSTEETVSDCIIAHEWCAGPSIKVKAIGVYPNPRGSYVNDMRPGDLIGLTVFGIDEDVLLQKCISDGGTDITPHPPTPDQVTYLWSVKNIRGVSGRLISSGGIGANSLLYQIPFCLSDYPVQDDIIVTLGNAGYKKDDEEVQVLFSIRLGATIEKIVHDGYEKQRELYKVSAHVSTSILNTPKDIVCPAIKGCCQPILPAVWEEGSKLSVKDPIRFTFAADSFPDNMILLSAEANDNDDLIIKCKQRDGKIISEKLAGIYDDPDYTWNVVSGDAKFLHNKGQSVVLIHNYYSTKPSSRNDLVIECRINDSRKQFVDAIPETLHKDRSARKKPVALVGVGDFELKPAGIIPTGIQGDNGEKAANIAADKYRNAGYEVKLDIDLDSSEIKTSFMDPATQSCFIIGHGSKFGFSTHDKKSFNDINVKVWTSEKWGCIRIPIVHPFLRDLNLLGCEMGKGDWHKRFFRLEHYFSYNYMVIDCPVDEVSEIISRANKFFPIKPRIAPPE